MRQGRSTKPADDGWIGKLGCEIGEGVTDDARRAYRPLSLWHGRSDVHFHLHELGAMVTPSRRFNLIGPDRSGKTVERFLAVYMDRMEGAEFSFEAKSERAAARIACSYEVERRGAFEYRACTLVGLLKFTGGYYWRGLDKALIERYSPFKCRCAGCLQRKPKAWMREVGGELFCRVCSAGHEAIELPQFDVELHLPQVPLIERERQDLVA